MTIVRAIHLQNFHNQIYKFNKHFLTSSDKYVSTQYIEFRKKVKHSHYRSGQALSFPGG